MHLAQYREHPLHPALRRHVAGAWSVTLDAGAEPVRHRVVPDGCVDIVLRADGSAPPAVAGPATGPLLVEMEPGTAVLGLRFRPGAAPFVLGVAAAELRDRTVPLDAVLGRRLAAEAERGGPALQRLVARRLGETDVLVDAAIARLIAAPATSVRELAADVALSERQLRRRFEAAVGYGPRRLARVLRLQALLGHARRSPEAIGARLAVDAGYADEAHMGRDVRALAGTTARTLLGERGRSVQAGDAAVRHAA